MQYRHPVTVSGRTVYPLAADDPSSVATAIVDYNGNGAIDAGDHTGTPGQYFTEPLLDHLATGGVYVRWANMAWRR